MKEHVLRLTVKAMGGRSHGFLEITCHDLGSKGESLQGKATLGTELPSHRHGPMPLAGRQSPRQVVGHG